MAGREDLLIRQGLAAAPQAPHEPTVGIPGEDGVQQVPVSVGQFLLLDAIVTALKAQQETLDAILAELVAQRAAV